jgi:hypothetical protein
MKDRKVILSTLWIFAIANYIYCDILSHMNPEFLKVLLGEGQFPGLPPIDQKFLLWAGILMEIPISMILLSRVLNYKSNRVINMIAGSLMTLVQIGSLFIGTPEYHYFFYSIIEIATTAFIVVYAWKWRNPEMA